MEQNKFHWADYVLFVLTLLISFAIGIYSALTGDKQRTTGEYFMGNRRLRLFPVAVSLLVTYVSGISVLGNPAEVYTYGTLFMMYVFSQLIGIIFSAIVIVPLLYPLKLTTISQYTKLRFQSNVVTYVFSVGTLISYGFLNGIQLYAPSIALEAVSNIPIWVTVSVVGILATIYTSLGGIKGVIWTDCFQCFVVLGGLLVVLILGVVRVGGFGRVYELNDEWNRIKILDFDPDPTKRMTIWAVLVNILVWVCLSATQPALQRYSSLPTLKKAKIAVMVNAPGLFISGLLNCFSGVVAFAYYADKGCDPVKAKYISSSNQILPYFVMDVVGFPGFPGIFTASLFSACLSTYSSSLNSMAALVYEDFLKERMKLKSKATHAKVTKAIVAIFGIQSIAMAFLIKEVGGTLIQMTYTVIGCTAGPLFSVILVGASLPKINALGMLISLTVSFGSVLWLGTGAKVAEITAPALSSPTYGCHLLNTTTMSNISYALHNETYTRILPNDILLHSNLTVITSENYHTFLHGVDRIYAISYLWYPCISIFICYIVGFITTFIPGLKETRPISKKLILPFLRHGYFNCGEDIDDTKDEDDLELKEHLSKKGESTLNNNNLPEQNEKLYAT